MRVCVQCAGLLEGEGAARWQCGRCGHVPLQRDGFLAFAPALAQANDGFNRETFAGLAEVEPHNFWFAARNRLIGWLLRRYFGQAARMLEIGCGTGFVLSGLRRAFPALQLFGSEICTEGLAFAKARVPDVELFQMDARRIPFAGEFDVVGAFDVLEHIVEDQDVLRAMYRAVCPGGGILITVPQHRWLWSAFDEYAGHKRRYRRRELVHKVAAAGFEIVDCGSFCTMLLPLMLASRLRDPRLKPGYDVLKELRINRGPNAVLRAALDVERAAMRAGVRFPLGGSLFLVARRVKTASDTPA